MRIKPSLSHLKEANKTLSFIVRMKQVNLSFLPRKKRAKTSLSPMKEASKLLSPLKDANKIFPFSFERSE
jgi:hypothetical protein